MMVLPIDNLGEVLLKLNGAGVTIGGTFPPSFSLSGESLR